MPKGIVFSAHGLKPDLATVALLARLELAARRRGRRLRVVAVSDDLRDLLAFVGLDDVIGLEPAETARRTC